MNMKKIEGCLRCIDGDLLLTAVGLVLALNPSGAMAWLIKLLGWIFVASGAAKLIVPAVNHRAIATKTWIWNGLSIAAGVVLLTWPLLLVDLMGQVLGVMLIAAGLRDVGSHRMSKRDILTVIGGVILLAMPRALTNTVLIGIGVVLMVIGGIRIADCVFHKKYLEEGEDPNIIDAL